MLRTLLMINFLMVLVVSCRKPIPEIPNEEELITSCRVYMVDTLNMDTVTFLFSDIDGDGGDEPYIYSPILAPMTYYACYTELSNEQYNPAVDITEEVIEEAEEHQFFYLMDTTYFNRGYLDEDNQGHPLGQKWFLQTGAAIETSFMVILRHEPYKADSSVINGDVSKAGGETDLEIEFDLHVK